MRIIQILVASLLTAGLAACGSSESGDMSAADQANGAQAAAAGGTDPCSLVTAEEVSQVLGDQIVATKPAEGSCTYETADAQASSVTVELDQSDAAGQMEVAKRTAGILRDMGAEAAKEGPAGQDVNAMLSESGDTPNVGDEAFFGANQQLSVRKGNSYVAIQPPIMRSRMAAGNPMLSADDKKRIALEIAEKAVSRLP